MLGVRPWLLLFPAAVLLGRLTVPPGASLALVWPAAGVGALWVLDSQRADRARAAADAHRRLPDPRRPRLDASRLTWLRPRSTVALAGIGLMTLVINRTTGAPLGSAALFALANLVQALVLAVLLRTGGATSRGALALRQPRDIVTTVLAALVSALASAPVTALAARDQEWTLALRSSALLVMRNATSAVIVLVIVASLTTPLTGRGADRRRVGEALLCLTASSAAYLVVFDPRTSLPMTWLLVPFTVWAGARLGLRYAGVHLCLMAAVAVLYTLHGQGPFVSAGSPGMRAVSAQGFLAMLALLGTHLALVDHDRWSALSAALRGQRSLRQLLESALVGNAVVLLEGPDRGTVDWANPAFARLVQVAEPTGRLLTDLTPPDSHDVVAAILAGLDDRGEWQGELRLRGHDGSPWWAEVAAVRDPSDTARATVQLIDVTSRKDVEASLEQLALHDALTGLPNRVLLREGLQRMLDGALRTGHLVAVVFLDLDHFKGVNDAFGHAAGDELLIQVGSRLRAAARGGDLVARLGGDEFVVAAGDIHEETEARALADRLLACFDAPFHVAGTAIRAGTSGGIAVGTGTSTAEELLDRSDGALYQVKRLGRGAIASSDDGLVEELRERATLAEDVRHALARRELEVRFEPIVSTDTLAVVGQEALLDWHHPRAGVLSARAHQSWLRLAQQAGVLESMASLLLLQACEAAAQWPGAQSVHVDVVSPQALTLDLAQLVADALETTGLAPRRLVLEFSETQVVANGEALVPVLVRLREIGVRVAVDDFGTASTRLAALAALPVDVVKLSGELVARLDGARAARGVARGVIAAAQELSWEVVATGVSSPRILEALRELGCGLAQGEACHAGAAALAGPPPAASLPEPSARRSQLRAPVGPLDALVPHPREPRAS